MDILLFLYSLEAPLIFPDAVTLCTRQIWVVDQLIPGQGSPCLPQPHAGHCVPALPWEGAGVAGTGGGPFPPSAPGQWGAGTHISEKTTKHTVMAPTAVCTGLCLFSPKFAVFHSLSWQLWDQQNLSASEVPYVRRDE